MTLHRTAALASVRLGERVVAFPSQPRCRVCQHARRDDIERLLLMGYSYASVRHQLALGEEISTRNIGDHVRNRHLPLDVQETQEIVQEMASERGDVVGEVVEVMADRLALARRIVARVQQRLEAREMEPELKDGLAALALLARYEATDDGVDRETILKGFLAYLTEARNVMSAEQFSEFSRRLGRNPELRSLLGPVVAG